jgi:hypothetical protein
MFKTKFIWAIALAFLFTLPILANAEYYYLVSYGACNNDSLGCDVLLRRIDLDSSKVTDSILISVGGCILNKKPIRLVVNEGIYLTIFVGTGMFAKNSSPGLTSIFYKIVKASDPLTIAKADSFMGCSLGYRMQYPDEPNFRFSVYVDTNDREIFQAGLYSLDTNLNFIRVGSFEKESWPDGIRKLHEFEFFNRVNLPNRHNLFYAT